MPTEHGPESPKGVSSQIMNPAPVSWRDKAALDDLFMAAAEGDAAAVPRLLGALQTAPAEPLEQWPAEAAGVWRNGIEIALDGMDRKALLPFRDLLLGVCQIGYDSTRFRDLLAALFRQLAPDYLDPAGLLAALGVHDAAVPTPVIARRWQVFGVLRPGVFAYHPAHGLGVVEELDAMANEVRLRCQRTVTLPLAVVLGQATLVRPASWLQDLLKGESGAREALGEANARERAFQALASAAPVSPAALRAILTAKALSPAEAERLLEGPAAVPAEQDQQPLPAPGQARPWHQARGVAELVGLLDTRGTLSDEGADLAGVGAILRTASEREALVGDCVQAIARLQHAFGGKPWLEALLAELGPRALCWTSRELFAAESDRLPGRLVTPWFEATAVARGPAFLAEAAMALPLRLWSYAEQVAAERSGDPRLFPETAVREVTRGSPSADVLVWLYRNGGDARQMLASPPLLFRTLQRPVRGAYIKARKELSKLLMEDRDFQRLIMRDGDPDAVLALVQAARHTPLLDAGERQSLLVKIVRVFPEARSLVEERRQPARKGVGKMTSRRSYALRHRELERIVQQEIPANARAIAHARGFGDLSENAEYKAAKERQAYLAARRAELENDLHEVRVADFAQTVVGDTVVPGCTVTLRYPDGRTDVFHILGLWDSAPEKGHLSYESPVGRALLGAAVGDSVEMPTGERAALESVTPLPPELLAWLQTAEPEET